MPKRAIKNCSKHGEALAISDNFCQECGEALTIEENPHRGDTPLVFEYATPKGSPWQGGDKYYCNTCRQVFYLIHGTRENNGRQHCPNCAQPYVFESYA